MCGREDVQLCEDGPPAGALVHNDLHHPRAVAAGLGAVYDPNGNYANGDPVIYSRRPILFRLRTVSQVRQLVNRLKN